MDRRFLLHLHYPLVRTLLLLLRFESAVYTRKCYVTFGAVPTTHCRFENSLVSLMPRKAGEATRSLRPGPAQMFSHRPSRKKPVRQLHLAIGGKRDLWSRLEKLCLLFCLPIWKPSPCLDTTHMQRLKTQFLARRNLLCDWE